jgi:heptaprenyl diphosphate synthase
MKTDDRGGQDGIFPLTVLLALAATLLGVVDGMIPRPLPFFKTGLANVITVIAALRYGTGKAISVNLLRSVAVSLFYGTLATPAFLLSLSGGFFSALLMGLLARLVPRRISVTALSMAGSTMSLSVQLVSAVLILPGIPASSLVLPLAVWGVLSGAATGVVAALLLRNGFPDKLFAGLVLEPRGG